MLRRVFLSVPAGFLLRAQDPPPSDVPLLTTADLKKLMDEKREQFFILDVREPKELEELGALKGSVNIPLGELESRLTEIPRNRPLLVA